MALTLRSSRVIEASAPRTRLRSWTLCKAIPCDAYLMDVNFAAAASAAVLGGIVPPDTFGGTVLPDGSADRPPEAAVLPKGLMDLEG